MVKCKGFGANIYWLFHIYLATCFCRIGLNFSFPDQYMYIVGRILLVCRRVHLLPNRSGLVGSKVTLIVFDGTRFTLNEYSIKESRADPKWNYLYPIESVIGYINCSKIVIYTCTNRTGVFSFKLSTEHANFYKQLHSRKMLTTNYWSSSNCERI